MNAIDLTKMGVAMLYARTRPRDTGNLLENSIVARNLQKTSGEIKIGGDIAPYAVYLQYCDNVGTSDKPNRHKNWVNIWIKNEFVPAIKNAFKEFGYN